MLSRRSFLRGAGGVALGVPLMASWGRTSQAAQTPPKRIVFVFTPCGSVYDQRVASFSETDEAAFTLGPSLLPLAPHQADLLLLEGLDLGTSLTGPGDAHQIGIGHLLTGVPLEEGKLFSPFDDGNLTVGWGGGPSLDQVIAEHVGNSTWLRSLELGVQTLLGPAQTVLSTLVYRGANQPVPTIDDPRRTYERLFGVTPDAGLSLQELRAQRLSVLDVVKGEFDHVAGQLSGADAAKLEAHAELVRDLEKRWEAADLAADCAQPAAPTLATPFDEASFGAVSRAQIDLITTALTCDLTRVATLQLSYAGSNRLLADLDPKGEGHHALTHTGQTDEVVAARVAIEAWYAGEIAYLLEQLGSVPEGDGTLLDSTLVVWLNEMSDPDPHTFSPMPVVLAGGLGGAVDTGRRVQLGTAFMNDLHVAVAQAMGLSIDTFGHPDFVTGPIGGLKA